MIDAGEFLEHADVFGNYYGTARSSLIDAFAKGKDLLLDIDVQGASQVRQRCRMPSVSSSCRRHRRFLPTVCAIAAAPKAAVQEEIIVRRLAKARQEIENYREYGYILVNDILDRAVEEMAAIVAAERMSRNHGPATPDDEELIAKAEKCRQRNSEARIKPVLQAFGVVNAEAAPV